MSALIQHTNALIAESNLWDLFKCESVFWESHFQSVITEIISV